MVREADPTNEQMEAIQRDIQELRKELQDKEWYELTAKVRLLENLFQNRKCNLLSEQMEQMVADCLKMKAAYVATIQELKKDERFRAEKSRPSSQIYAIYARLKGDFKEFSSCVS